MKAAVTPSIVNRRLSSKSQPPFGTNDKNMQAGTILVVDGYGVSLNVEGGHLVVRDGFGPASKRRTIMVPKGRSKISRIVIRAPAGTLSLAALDWCNQMDIPIAVLASDSRIASCHVMPSRSDGPLKRVQAIAALMEEGVEIARELLRSKLRSQISAIESDLPALGASGAPGIAGKAIAEIASALEKLALDTELRDLLSREGYAARMYWTVLTGAILPWPDWTHKRIPDHWRTVSPREYGRRENVRDATDPFNALLNYGYTLLEVETRIACALEGLDPDLGLLHVDSRLRESLIYDLEEPIRVKVDSLTLAFCLREGLRPHMFLERTDGVVRLSSDMARAYANWIMPKLRQPAENAAATFSRLVRRIVVPYRLVDYRKADLRPSTPSANGICGYCKQPLKKSSLKFCSRHCYLRYSVEVAKPIEKAQVKLAELRSQGLSPGHGGEAAITRGRAIAESNRRRRLDLTDDERRARRAKQQRERRSRFKFSSEGQL